MKNESYLENVKRVSREASERRRSILDSIAELEIELKDLDGRKKAQKEALENRIKQERKWVERIEEDIHTFDTLETFADEVQEMDKKINELCEIRKERFPLYLSNTRWLKGYFYI